MMVLFVGCGFEAFSYEICFVRTSTHSPEFEDGVMERTSGMPGASQKKHGELLGAQLYPQNHKGNMQGS